MERGVGVMIFTVIGAGMVLYGGYLIGCIKKMDEKTNQLKRVK